MKRLPALALAGLMLAGCATVDPAADFARTRGLAADTTGVGDLYDPDQPALTSGQIDAVFADGLTLDEALRLALLNNRRFQAEFMRIAVARADWVQAGLLTNPSLEAGVMFPLGGGRSNVQASLAQNLLQILRIPVKTEMAQQQVNEAVLTIARRAGELVADVRTAYYDVVAAEELLHVDRENQELVRASFNAIERQKGAGVASALDLNLGQGQLLTADLAVLTTRLGAANARRRLGTLLSLDRDMEAVKLTDTFAHPSTAAASAEELIASAREHRLDLQAARAVVDGAEAALALERSKAIGEASIGGSVERMERRGGSGPSMDVMAGPMLSLEVPIFDQNQAQVARARYMRQQAVSQYEDLSLTIAQDVRTAHDRARTANQMLTFYRDQLLPQAEEGFRLAGETYRAGRLGLLNLLESQRALLEARRGFVLIQHESATAGALLERTIGTPQR